MSFSDDQQSTIITREDYLCKGCKHSISQPIFYNGEIWHNSCFSIHNVWKTSYSVAILFFNIHVDDMDLEHHLERVWETFNDMDACVQTNCSILMKELKRNNKPMESAFIMDSCAVLLEQLQAILWVFENLQNIYKDKINRQVYKSTLDDLKNIVITVREYLDFCTREIKLGMNSAAILALSIRESRFAVSNCLRYLVLASLAMDKPYLDFILKKLLEKSYNLALLPVCNETYGNLYERDTFALCNIRYRHLLMTDTVKTSSLHRNGKMKGFIYVNYEGLSSMPESNISPEEYDTKIKDAVPVSCTIESVYKHRRVPTVFRHDIHEPKIEKQSKKESINKRISVLVDNRRNSFCPDAGSRTDSASIRVRFDNDEIEMNSHGGKSSYRTLAAKISDQNESDSDSVFSIKKKVPILFSKTKNILAIFKRILQSGLKVN
ncbi:hypothetical protein HDV04_000753 [Boothiomyces sp. JEL0838]|nr:hypothetical protein HDV04_000753 [Boothiomyces sp. JEL0838]